MSASSNEVRTVSLDKLFNPRSIAIVGVSTKKAIFQVGGRAVFDHLRLHEYPGRIDLVTREPAVIDGVESVTDLAMLEHTPDCVLVSVPADDVFPVVEKALGLGCRSFVVITGGFSESGSDGAARQAKLAELVAAHRGAMLGPNTTGFVNFAERVAMSSTSRISAALAPIGEIGIVVQSGALGSALLEEAARGGIGLSHLISTGNEAVTTLADCVDYLVDDPATRVIALYVEGFRQPDRMLEAARRAHAAGKPIVVYKTGRSDAGRRAAAGHTGALVGARGSYEAAVRQLGWIDVRSIEDLLPVAHYVAQPGAAARTMGIITVSGGFGGCVADALEETGAVSLPTPGPATVERMRNDVPAFLSANNPVDIGGTPFRRPGGFAECLDAFADDPALNAIAVANTPIVPPWGADVAEAVKATHARTGKPVSVIWPSEIFNGEALRDLRAAGTPTFTRVDTFTAAVAGAAALATARDKPSRLLREGRSNSTPSLDVDLETLDEAASKSFLKLAGLPFPAETFVSGMDMAKVREAAETIGYPVTLKGIARGVVHKSEFGLVAVALPDTEALETRAAAMLESADRNNLEFEGFLVAETVRPQAEVIVGLGLDPEFGPTLTFGAGGIYTEIMQDVATRVLPLDEDEVRGMIESCRISRILQGARGRPLLDVDALVAMVSGVAALAPRLGPDFAGLELNPVGVGLAGEGAWPLDASVFKARCSA
ncbi:acetate--CoA ligase family protein [Microbaculum marinisediminis]|uniref:Acetate--CoA ligase family protein n=1 Tax=Microbaculum marinisediminis TaxID=2931392 RepID=A0AAW5QY73_9HYPH|nr:acetate--CoA ligase [Microbaculum sp. A6E488]MCT8971371.1 acetate--CoA ligase family protein [Microbaculum sp. A6E488]